MLQAPYSKIQIQKILKANRAFKFVESFDDVKDCYNQQIYAIEKDSVALKELVNEGLFPIDDRILKFQKGIYHIIDIITKEIDIKSETKMFDIAYVLYKKGDSEEYWNRVYQIQIKHLFNFISQVDFSYTYQPKDLIGKSIYIKSMELIESASSYKVLWGVYGDLERYDNELLEKIEFQASLFYQESEDYLMLEVEERALDEEYNSIENQVERYNEDQYLNSEDYFLQILEDRAMEESLDTDLFDDYSIDDFDEYR